MNPSDIWLKIKLKLNVTVVLIAVNVAAFGLSSLLRVSMGQTNALLLLGAEYVPDILNGQFWRLVMPSFLHANLMHLVLNMWALYHLGHAIETFYGGKKLLIVYILSGFLGSLLSASVTLVSVFLDQGQSGFPISVGASAAVFGFVGLLLGNKFKKNTYSVSIDNYINTSQLWLFVGYNVIIGFGINFLGGTSLAINNVAHIGGFLAGLLLGMTLDLVNTTHQSNLKVALEKALYFFAISLLVLSLVGATFYFFLNF